MVTTAAQSRRFSRLLAALHAAPTAARLRALAEEALATLSPATPPRERENWIRAIFQRDSAARSPAPADPDSWFELLRPHFLDCLVRLRGEPPPAPNSPPGTATSLAGLTPREQAVLALVALGQTDGRIARALGISPRTVGKHVENILAKTGAESRAGAVAALYGRQN
jgi:DNA-binding NarL/FixJ family response regulator